MVQVQQRILSRANPLRRRAAVRRLAGPALACALLLGFQPLSGAKKFFSDDPLRREPPPLEVRKPRARNINEYFDFFQNTFFEPGKKEREAGLIPRARNVNTMGEVPDSGWYENRMGSRPMSLEELVRGPGVSHAPSMEGPWKVLKGKNQGVTPGLFIEDVKGRRYLVKFDPLSNPELASAADVIGAKFFYALGYNVPENYIVYFDRKQLQVTARSSITDRTGRERAMDERDVEDLLDQAPRGADGRYRAMASLLIPGEPLGPFRFYDTRSDDPNDIVPHEDRRELRGLFVFASWLNHTDSKSINTLDMLVQEAGRSFIKHYLIDFGAILGSDSFEAKSPRAGNVYFFDFKPAAIQFLTLGLYVPAWQRADYPHMPAVGNFESSVFDPLKWKPNYPNSAFDARLPDDTFWAAKKVMAFRDDQIRALVETGAFSDSRAAEYLTKNLIIRRDKIGRAYFSQMLPLDDFAVQDGKLVFDDLAVKYHFASPRHYSIEWARFDNASQRKTAIQSTRGFELPGEIRKAAPGQYFAAEIRGEDPGQKITVYLRTAAARPEVVGVDRAW